MIGPTRVAFHWQQLGQAEDAACGVGTLIATMIYPIQVFLFFFFFLAVSHNKAPYMTKMEINSPHPKRRRAAGLSAGFECLTQVTNAQRA
jgi:hypothetical protein